MKIWRSDFIYYFSILIPILANGLLFFYIFKGAENMPITTLSDQAIFLIKFFWLTGIVVAVSNFIGLVWFGNPERENSSTIKKFKKIGWGSKDFLVVVYVSRGDNVHALKRSVNASHALLERHNVSHRIDIVTDLPVEKEVSSNNQNTIFHLVPPSYKTQNGAKWKARALHYVVEQHKKDKQLLSSKGKNVWILHLDEESQVTPSSIAGISQFISDPNNKNVIGQGEIKYNAHNYGDNLLITWADSIRSGDDLGRFRFQFGLFSKPFFGMHGSYILTPLHIEQKFGFDLGHKGSVTEDAYFALKCSETGIKFKWVNGYIREQSPFSLKAIAKQRRRWFHGLLTLSFDREIKLKTRIPLMINTLLWSVAWIGPIATILSLTFGGYFPIAFLITASLLQGFYTSAYMVGAMRNIIDIKEKMPVWKKITIYFGTLLSVHVVNIIEGFAVLYALIRPVKTFDVVNKN